LLLCNIRASSLASLSLSILIYEIEMINPISWANCKYHTGITCKILTWKI
jgi:hypothetical protein